jgi:hypothetical protein
MATEATLPAGRDYGAGRAEACLFVLVDPAASAGAGPAARTAWAADSRAMGTRNGEQLT